jgi:hypothetical protein
MKLLMYSTDRALFDEESPVRARLLEQANLATTLDVVVLTPRGEKFKQFKLGRKLTVHPTSSRSKFSYLPDAYKLGKSILEKAEDKTKTRGDSTLPVTSISPGARCSSVFFIFYLVP